ncbi:hypothetical protein CXB51_002263 [Gossypium anomalum]|uniref:VQ domain-containing protein n=1 Tax=Gossypium anomalum TaxID=47600 RepID=A0A8J5ZDG6_9ROSI|nr:hypothetical protein CXB51_002263 [Gossypium anomalum]
MENLRMMRNQTRMSPSNSSPSSSLSIHKNSQTISKPKIRIIHIFAPEIIKTDAANFRELVQRLTGKPPQQKGCKRKPRIGGKDDKPMELRTGFLAGIETRERVKEEEGGGFLSGFGDLDGFIQEMGEFPLLPLDDSHHMHGFEEAQLMA